MEATLEGQDINVHIRTSKVPGGELKCWPDSLADDYIHRPLQKEFEDICFYDMTRQYKKIYKSYKLIQYTVRRPKYPSKSPLFFGSLSGYEPFLRFLRVGGRIVSEGCLAFGSAMKYLLSPTLSGGEAALPLRCSPA
jgi:hypothetical protein